MSLLVRHAVFDEIKVLHPLVGGAVGHVAPAAGGPQLGFRGGNGDVEGQLAVEAQVLVDVRGGGLAGLDGLDDRRGTGGAVAAGVDAVRAGHGAGGVRLQGAGPGGGDARLREVAELDGLADGDDHHVRR